MRISLFSSFFAVWACIVVGAFSAAAQSGLPAVADWSTSFHLVHAQKGDILFRGSFVGPLTHRLGFQLDLDAGLKERTFFYSSVPGRPSTGLQIQKGAGLSLFLRDPKRYSVSAFSTVHQWNTIHTRHRGISVDLYLGRLTLAGLATSGERHYTDFSTQTGFPNGSSDVRRPQFAQALVSYYPGDRAKLSASAGIETITTGTVTEYTLRFFNLAFEYQVDTGGTLATFYVAYQRTVADNFCPECSDANISAGIRLDFDATTGGSLIDSDRKTGGIRERPQAPAPYLITSSYEIVVECKGCTSGSSGTCQSAGTKLCSVPTNDKCPRRFSLCTETRILDYIKGF